MSPWVPYFHVSLVHGYPAILLHCHSVTLSTCHPVGLVTCYPATLLTSFPCSLATRHPPYVVVLEAQLAQRHVGAVALSRLNDLLEAGTQGDLRRNDAAQRVAKCRAVLPACPASNAGHTASILHRPTTPEYKPSPSSSTASRGIPGGQSHCSPSRLSYQQLRSQRSAHRAHLAHTMSQNPRNSSCRYIPQANPSLQLMVGPAPCFLPSSLGYRVLSTTWGLEESAGNNAWR